MILFKLSRPMASYWYFWGMYVNGFNDSEHCKKCLLGKQSKRVALSTRAEAWVPMSEHDYKYVYLCAGYGTRKAGTWSKNVHIALQHEKGAELVEYEAADGLTIAIRNAKILPIPALEDGFRGLGRNYTTCRNFQFGTHYLA